MSTVSAETVTDKRWGVPGQNDMVIHRPDLKATVDMEGVSRSAVGYSKRYFGPYPQHNIWRFIHGVFPTSAGRVFWTANAPFGDVAVEITPKFEHETRLENNKMAGRMR